ncbi:hypothetical protein BN1012_Phect24 [Candidatus Phaeomarinobacter ectocarpi]|uniref:Uncharacterized protein n=1 Tax=Candidatus Phaeomarinibacter ectocarpi TaxID=1458461 RepID=X5M5U5_9HYPH|nr:hypothetical protein BN1012_Phect24 [Candidatus Phaeomarinobacter ectocarpi]
MQGRMDCMVCWVWVRARHVTTLWAASASRKEPQAKDAGAQKKSGPLNNSGPLQMLDA